MGLRQDQLILKSQFIKFCPRWLRHFNAVELLTKTEKGTNTIPPVELWANIIPTVMLLDELRHRLGYPIIVNSCYRNKTYNTGIGGAKLSMHMEFNAIDFTGRKGTPKDWAAGLFDLREQGWTVGGIGVYDSFVHVDTRTLLGKPFAVW